MPSWAASVSRPTNLLKAGRIEWLSSALRRRRALPLPRVPLLRVRSASAYISPTTINPQASIPAERKDIYNSLSYLGGAAEAYVNISRLQLALRGVSTQDAVTRVAVLGLNSQLTAQRLVRLLLADPLGSEETWEQELEKLNNEDGRPILLRFGDESDAHPPNPLYKILSVPSRLLGTHNLEILISTLDTNIPRDLASTLAERSDDAILVPKLQAPSTKGLPIPFPVHKTLLVGEGLESAISYGRFTSDRKGDSADLVKVAIDLPPPLKEAEQDVGSCSMVNVQVGTEALQSFRESISNSSVYERGWFRSGMPLLSQWLARGLQPSEPISPIAKSLIASIADNTEANIMKEDSGKIQALATSPSHQETSESVLSHLENWAEKSHTELRDQLDEAFSAKNWRKLAWWKLLWRVDDVSMIMSEILERRWLVDAEKNAIFLAGRMNQAGFPDNIHELPISIPTEHRSDSDGPMPLDAEKPNTQVSTEVREPQPWPSQIAMSRGSLLKETVPPLQALAQRLLLEAFSTTSVGSALSALLYVSVSSFSVFDAGAAAVLGLMFSLRRLQKRWEGGREMWQGEVREEGRRALKQTEDLVRLIISNSKKPIVEDTGIKDRRLAREAVERVRAALEKV
ncbi:hypothetical protein BS50DRAFT_539665 [Corynespora cassiicola Philippines]|uniref:Mmc1 C-terminal domain-containing protein n=1 Tax=Corynespora cassiicola Philippines TaxID=1448308 RepID=A0A2T2P9T8_CORCC|nr:hypothetical protein BS50DRAFT_539665 [Corynespora cassiicola Philippines]